MKKQLTKRQLNILLLIIKTYFKTGEPVSSRILSKLYKEKNETTTSPATIRNEMADLQDMGYIFSQYKSSGRIPSDKSYRLYVDLLLKKEKNKIKDMHKIVLNKVDKLEKIFSQITNILSNNTSYPVISTTKLNNLKKIKFIQISKIEKKRILIIIVLDNNLVKNKIIDTNDELKDKEILKLNILLNNYLAGQILGNINLMIIKKLKNKSNHNDILDKILKALLDMINIEDLEIYTSGTNNIFKYPELREKETAQEILSVFEKKEKIDKLIDVIKSDDNQINVYIGNENNNDKMKNCSIVTAKCILDKGVIGTIGIIGPKRMNYKKVVGSLSQLISKLNDLYNNGGSLNEKQ